MKRMVERARFFTTRRIAFCIAAIMVLGGAGGFQLARHLALVGPAQGDIARAAPCNASQYVSGISSTGVATCSETYGLATGTGLVTIGEPIQIPKWTGTTITGFPNIVLSTDCDLAIGVTADFRGMRGDRHAGSISFGGQPQRCTVTFGDAYATDPSCVASSNSVASTILSYRASRNGITFENPHAGETAFWICYPESEDRVMNLNGNIPLGETSNTLNLPVRSSVDDVETYSRITSTTWGISNAFTITPAIGHTTLSAIAPTNQTTSYGFYMNMPIKPSEMQIAKKAADDGWALWKTRGFVGSFCGIYRADIDSCETGWEASWARHP